MRNDETGKVQRCNRGEKEFEEYAGKQDRTGGRGREDQWKQSVEGLKWDERQTVVAVAARETRSDSGRGRGRGGEREREGRSD